MQIRNLFGLALTLACAYATLDPATSNAKGKRPKTLNCSATKSSSDIQAAECSHNTRTHETQTFAVFEINHAYDDNNGAPYGTCEAYTCDPPTSDEMVADSDYWTFFWTGDVGSSGEGAGCIKDPQTGECGCENSDGEFIAGSDSCT